MKDDPIPAILRKIERDEAERASWPAHTRAWYDRARILATALSTARRDISQLKRTVEGHAAGWKHDLDVAHTLLREVLDFLSYPGLVVGAAERHRQALISRLVDVLKGTPEELPQRRCLLRVEKLFESGLRLPEGTPIWVQETGSGAIGHFYPDPYKFTSHAFALADDEYTVLVRAKL